MTNIYKFIKYYLPAILWMVVIFYFSSLPGLRYSETNVTLEIFLRKGAHIFEYAVLVWLVWRVFYRGHNLSLKKSLVYSFIISFFYAASDEWHQTFVLNRAGKIIDVVFDSLSIIIGLQLINVFIQKKITKSRIFILIILVMIIFGIELKMMRAGEEKKEEETIISETKDNQPVTSSTEDSKAEKNTSDSEDDIPDEKEEKIEEKETELVMPSQIKIAVPFTSQAPFANWDEYHEEACEEASIIMIKYYLDGKTLTKELAEKEIQGLISYQKEKYGDYKDTNAAKTAEIAKKYYGINNLKVVYDFKEEDIKKHLAKGKPIIIPAAGRLLGNPNFTPPGPLYHKLVLIGYEGDMIITNDPGTRKGEGYRYNLRTLYKAIHDFTGKKEDIEKGRKAMIILE